MKNRLLTTTVFLVFMIFFAGFGSSAVVINSQDWTDVQAGMQYADEIGEESYFTRTSDGSAVMNDLPAGVNVTVLQSTENPYLSNLDSQIRTRNYNYEETISFESENELIPEDIENFVVISEDRPSDAAIGATLAEVTDGWLIVANQDNLDEVETELEDANQVIKLGQFRRSLDQFVSQYETETIQGENRFDLSTQVSERINEETEVTSVKMSAGKYLESSMFEEDTPVLLTGTNFLAEETENYLLDNSQINGVVMLGAELGTVGEELNEAAEQNNRELSVFVKYGQATVGRGNEVQALSLFPLPTPSMNLRVTAAQYLTDQNKLLATIQNPSNVDGYALNSIVVKDRNDVAIASVGDDEPQYVSADSTELFTFDVNMTEETASTASAEFTTNYGTDEDSLDSFVPSSEEDVYGPPRILPISPISLEDRSNLNITQTVYDSNIPGFNVTVQNLGTRAYARLNLQNVTVDGLTTTLSSDIFQIDPNQTETVTIEGNLTEQDLEETQEVEVNARYGERRDFLLNSDTRRASIKMVEESGDGSPLVIVLILLIILTVLYIIYELI